MLYFLCLPEFLQFVFWGLRAEEHTKNRTGIGTETESTRKGCIQRMLEKIYKMTKKQTQQMIFAGLAVLLFLLPMPQCILPDLNSAIGMQATVLMLSLIYFGIIFTIEGLNKRLFLRRRGMAFLGIGGVGSDRSSFRPAFAGEGDFPVWDRASFRRIFLTCLLFYAVSDNSAVS